LGQLKELLALTLLGLFSSLSDSLLLKDITKSFLLQQGNPLIRVYFDIAHEIHQPLNILFMFLAPSLWLVALFGHSQIPRIILDSFGGLFVFRSVIALIFVNALLFIPAASASLLLGQVLAYIPFFVMVWGWLTWRIDCCGRDSPQQIISIPEAKSPITSFDYYHASIYSVLNQGKSGFSGVTRLGRSLALIHNLMLLNVWGLALARAYGLVQKML
jgi:hypothetical protein